MVCIDVVVVEMGFRVAKQDSGVVVEQSRVCAGKRDLRMRVTIEFFFFLSNYNANPHKPDPIRV